MADGFIEIDRALQGLLTQIGPQQRRNLARTIAARLRQSNQKRIASQVAPDGTPYPARLRQQKGKIRRQMFAKMRTTKWLKVKSTTSDVTLEFVGQAARIARVHHYGLRDRVSRDGPEHQYAERPLLGFSTADIAALESLVLDHIGL